MSGIHIITKRHSTLITSLAVSIGLHALGIYFLATHPMMLHHSLRSLFGISIAAPEYLDIQEDQALAKKNYAVEEAFEHILVLSSHRQQPFDLVELPRAVTLSPYEEEILDSFHVVHSELDPSSFLQEGWAVRPFMECLEDSDVVLDEWMIAKEKIFALNAVQIHIPDYIGSYGMEQTLLPQEESVYIIDPIAISPSSYIASLESKMEESPTLESLMARSFLNRPLMDIDVKMIELDTSLGTHKLSEQVPFLALPAISKMHAPHIQMPSIDADFDEYLPESITQCSEWNDDFDLDIAFLPHPEGKGYIFSLALTPNFDISQHSLKHDILFIIDRSVRKPRFDVFKRAVVKALSSLQQGDTFNIYIVDKKMTRLHTKSIPVSQKMIRAAEYFLEKQSEDMLFSQGDIYSSLEKILPEIKNDGSIHSAILITDGVSQISSRKQSHVLRDWMEKNNGKLAVYTAAVGQKNDLLMLDLLSSISGGKLLWSDTHASFPRKLAKLVLDLRDPVACDVTVDALAAHSQTHISLSPAFLQAPVLFSHQPYVIFGSIDQPGPFELIIQGRHRDEWIAIKKTVSFIDGAKGDRNLLNRWSAQKAHRAYAQFLNDGKSAYLKEAKEILKKSRSEVAFE